MYNSKKIVKKARLLSQIQGRTPRTLAPELKSVSFTSNLAANTAGSILLLNGVAPGVALDQRVGRQILMARMDLSVVSQVTPGTGVDQRHRLVIVLDKQPNGAALAILDVLNAVSTADFPNLSNQKRFHIIHDRQWVLNATAEPFSARSYTLSIPLQTLVQYNTGVAGTIADIATNSLYAIAIGTEAAGATAGTVLVLGRIRYYDE